MNLMEEFLREPWLCWGVGSSVSAIIGFYSTVIVLELASYLGVTNQSLSYSTTKTREQALQQIRAKIPFTRQLREASWTILGVPMWINTLIASLLFPFIMSQPARVLPTLWELCCTFPVLYLLGDFFLYWGHRVQHESEWLWNNSHYYHHQVTTPSPITTAFIHPIDATLQAGLPIIMAAAIVRPHPVTYYLFTALRIAENVLNHSGLDSWFVDLISLKCLPMRASIRHHDMHHHFSNYSRNAKNYGEFFLLWDWLFGTLRST